MKASDLMTPDPACITPNDSVQDAARMMGSYNVGSLPVVEGGDNKRIVGIVTDRDLALGVIGEGRFDARVSDVMAPDPSSLRGGLNPGTALPQTSGGEKPRLKKYRPGARRGS